MKNPILLFWAKTSDDPDNPLRQNSFHPLICHMIDIASVAEAMWADSLPEVTKRRLARPFSLEGDLEKSGRIIAWLAGLHDLGKCSPPFALRGMHKPDTDQKKRLYELYVDTDLHCTSCSTASDVPHGFVTSLTLPEILKNEYQFPNKIASEVSQLIGGHHGIFANSTTLQNIQRSGNLALGGEAWDKARKEHVRTLKKILGVDLSDLTYDENALDRSTGMIFAGLVSVADWIGSDASFFKCRVEDSSKPFDLDIEEYLADSRKLATEALSNLGWDNWPRTTERKEFHELFSCIQDIRDLQQKAIEIAEMVDAPGVFVIEAPMGEGKTEAAMYLADAFNAKLGTRGIYFALPTMATSDQLFGRVADFLRGRFSDTENFVNLMLQHGHASLSDEFADSVHRFHEVQENLKNLYPDGESRPEIANIAAAEWFTYRKRGLLAPFGVGTIDQILFAALQTKHVFVRLFGLAHKTIIIDEVHAYDAYMTTLLERLLEWLAALGSPVIILSATLPKDRRSALIKAYLKGCGKIGRNEIPAPNGDTDEYPRISYALAAEANKSFKVTKLDKPPENGRTLRIEWKDDESFVEDIKAKLACGGCAAIICNTVGRAQEVYDLLKANNFFAGDASDGKPKLDLLHARYRFIDRQEREKRALLRFGKAGSEVPFTENGKKVEREVERPDMAVLVSTQIIEQSLDLDFDLMVSELAPVDLLLQRSGRLQRHDRESDKVSEDQKRPSAFRDPATGGKLPTLWILKPPLDDNGDLKIIAEGNQNGTPDFGVSGLIYDKHILLRSWLLLRDRETICIPAHVEDLIEAVYGNSKLKNDEEYRTVLDVSRNSLVLKRRRKEQKAKTALLTEIDDEDFYESFKSHLDENDPKRHAVLRAQTRDDERPTVATVILTQEEADGIDFVAKPGKDLVKYLIRREVSLSRPDITKHLVSQAEHRPEIWHKVPLLRNHRLVILDDSQEYRIENTVLRLDEEKGLVYE